ncbi:hypothetical protein C5E45_33535 [Nocardia nova]|uniref:Uncharacterized protein n=1 Tax=Nocardia nova TaxID=37330 RepID=A0A2S6AB40_9NOCA|nr:hypothetical protein C5E41_31260 [Nocardia nova]PPJ30726.1 hypothetical protein C5E45_33535 [Nocardia nova]
MRYIPCQKVEPVNAMKFNDVGDPLAATGSDRGLAVTSRALRGGGNSGRDGSQPRGGVESASRRMRYHRLHRKRMH